MRLAADFCRHWQKRKTNKLKNKASSTIKNLFIQADLIFNEDPSLSNRYVFLARRIAMAFRLRLPSELKRQYCRNCYSFLVPGKNLRIRIHKHRVIYYCLECKHFFRLPISKSKIIQKQKKN